MPFFCSIELLHYVASALAVKLNSLRARNATIVGYVGTLINRDDKVCLTALCP